MAASSFSALVLGTFPEVEAQLMEELEAGRELMQGRNADLVLLFTTPDWAPCLEDLVEVVKIGARCPLVVGTSADGIIARRVEEEAKSGVSIVGLALPEGASARVEIIESWDRPPARLDDPGGWIILANPFHLDAAGWSETWHQAHRDIPTYGGLASGGREPESIFLLGEGGRIDEPAIAIGFSGLELEGVVSQGCRPIGQPYTITGADGNIVSGIGSKPAFDMLEAAFNSLEEEEKKGAQGNILAGLAMSEYLERFARGDFLVRSILGGDRENGALALAASPQVGQTLQFQLRDAHSAHEDLEELLELHRLGSPLGNPFAGLLFSCTGRGEHLFGEAHHDALAVEEAFPGLEMAGFFCNGEIGPVSGKAHIHGFTASLALLRERPKQEKEAS